MAFEIQGIDDFAKALTYLDSERIAPKILESCAPIVRSAIIKRASRHRDTGAMQDSIKATKVVRNSYGYYICIRPTGKDAKGVRNMEKMAALEYGVDGKQPATPVLTPAVRDSEEKVLERMQEIFDQEVPL